MKTEYVRISTLEEQINLLGNNLTIINSLVKFLDIGMDENSDIKKADLENIITVIIRITERTKADFSELEQALNL